MNQLPNQNPSQNQKFKLQELAQAVNLQPETAKKTLLALGGFQVSSEGLTEYISGAFTHQKLVELARAEQLPNNAITALDILTAIARSQGLAPEYVAQRFAENEGMQSEGMPTRIDASRLSEAIAKQGAEIDQILLGADYQRNREWADKAATVSAVNQLDQFFQAKSRIANSGEFQDYVSSIFGTVGRGRLDALGKTNSNGELWIPTMEEYLSTPVLGTVPQTAPSLAASNPNPNLPQLTSTSSSTNSETSGSDSSSKLTPQSGNGFGKSPS
jgi:hypothetical protein